VQEEGDDPEEDDILFTTLNGIDIDSQQKEQ